MSFILVCPPDSFPGSRLNSAMDVDASSDDEGSAIAVESSRSSNCSHGDSSPRSPVRLRRQPRFGSVGLDRHPPSCIVHVVLVIVVVAMLSATGSLRGLLPNKMVQVAMLVSLLSSTMGASPVQSVELFAGCQSVSNGIREHGYASVALDFSTCRWGICLLTLFARRLQSSYQ